MVSYEDKWKMFQIVLRKYLVSSELRCLDNCLLKIGKLHQCRTEVMACIPD